MTEKFNMEMVVSVFSVVGCEDYHRMTVPSDWPLLMLSGEKC